MKKALTTTTRTVEEAKTLKLQRKFNLQPREADDLFDCVITFNAVAHRVLEISRDYGLSVAEVREIYEIRSEVGHNLSLEMIARLMDRFSLSGDDVVRLCDLVEDRMGAYDYFGTYMKNLMGFCDSMGIINPFAAIDFMEAEEDESP